MILTATFGINLYAGAGCASCEHGHGAEVKAATEVKTEVKADESCPDGVCASDKHDHKATEAAAKTRQRSGDAPATVNTLGLKPSSAVAFLSPFSMPEQANTMMEEEFPVPCLSTRNQRPKKSLKSFRTKIIDRNLLCQPQLPASHKLYTHLKSLGYTNLIEYPEGIDGWVAAGNPVNAPK